MSDTEVRNVIIIGSGPAGLTAAIYASRAMLRPLVLAGEQYGGQLMTTTLVENYPGFAKGIEGPALMNEMLEQAKEHGAEVLFKSATKVDLYGTVKEVYAGDQVYRAHAVIIGVGSTARRLNIPGESELWGKGVSTCATCDGNFYKEKVVAVIGGGDSAMEEANYLAMIAKKVYVVHRRDEFRASKIMQERTLENSKIEVLWNSEVTTVNGSDKVESLRVYNNQTKQTADIAVDGMFLSIGHIPNTDFLQGQIDLDNRGYGVTTEHTMSSVDGVFLAGEIIDQRYKQAVVTAGMGCMAAMDAEKWLQECGLC